MAGSAKRRKAAKRTPAAKSRATAKRPATTRRTTTKPAGGAKRRPSTRKAATPALAKAERRTTRRLTPDDTVTRLQAQLAVIESVHAALAARRDIQGIYDAVGDKIREIFHRADIGIRIYDPDTSLVHFPYYFKDGQPLDVASEPLGDTGISAHVLRTRETLVINEDVPEAIVKYGSRILGPALEKSSVFVPLIVGGRARGLLNLLDMHREHAFSDSDVRLLQTLANSMSVALENARLFDETQRLLKETEQRAAELAVINSIQEGMAAELDFQAIVDIVGDKLREVFHTGDIGIRWNDEQAALVHYLYLYEHGVRIRPEPTPLDPDSAIVKAMQARRPFDLNSPAEAEALGIGVIPGTDRTQSSVFVPIVGSDRVLGMIAIENYQHENAFGESDVRLLSTVASSMGIALENARLFDETQRLFKESEQRAAELAIINSVQQALAAELTCKAIYDAVGDKIREIFHRQTWASASLIRSGPDPLPIPTMQGKRVTDRAHAARGHRIRRPRPAHARTAGHQRQHDAGNGAVRQLPRCPATRVQKSRSWYR